MRRRLNQFFFERVLLYNEDVASGELNESIDTLYQYRERRPGSRVATTSGSRNGPTAVFRPRFENVDFGGASWNRTSDLSIISAAL